MRLALFNLVLSCCVTLIIWNSPSSGFKIRYGRERSRILKLKKRKGAILTRLNLLTRTRGIGIFPCRATPEDSTPEPESEKEEGTQESFENIVEEEKPKRMPNNPVIEQDLENFDPLFRNIPTLRTLKRNIKLEDRPGAFSAPDYARDFIEQDAWDFHPNKIRVRGKYFSKLYQYELREPMKRHENDTGSPEVVIASLTAKIDYISSHVKNNKKDVQAKRQLVRLATKRRKLLEYLYRKKRDTFYMLIKTFNLPFDESRFSYKRILPENIYSQYRRTKLRPYMHLGLLSPNTQNKKGKSANSNYSRPVYTILDSKPSTTEQKSIKVDNSNILILNSDNFNEISKYPGKIKTGINDALVITPLHNLNLNSVFGESLFEKRKRNEKILHLAELVYLSDGIIVPIDYNELKSNGCRHVYNLKLANILIFFLRECFEQARYPNVHFIVYNWNEISTWNSYRNSFLRRQKKEIHQILNEFIAESGKISTTCEFTNSSEKHDWVTKLYPSIKERIKLHRDCKSDLESDFNGRVKSCEVIKAFRKQTQDSSDDLVSRLNPNQLQELKNLAPSYNQLIELIKVQRERMITFLNDTSNYGHPVEWYKREIDALVNNSLNELVATMHVVKGCENFAKELKNRLVESLKSIIIEFIDTLSLRMHDEIVQEFRNNISSLTISPNLDEELEDAIRTADSLYFKKRKSLEPKILRNDPVYKAKFQSQRADLIQNLKEISNHILEYAISNGMYYHRISIRDGILLLPQNFVLKYLNRLLDKIKIPLRISLNYLSPSAFGFSNFFRLVISPRHARYRSKDTLSPQICRYFTHSDSVNKIIP
ncbi:ribosomal protein S15 domain-containing protein [Theileria equi strain WA]|uniref:Ribosomal protein S15 domain-containing protein n=1 Tax=Theileria equi strain WA TaxID=1537102 RepID=L0B172_THEEQ|nr:ribosomal protein S15 domain-containing protein [Theileria equi strain WA]AFZ81258.1 ribosomal protein S15 domain-containing protein [Theileria equi strain WA]|eukprot:XP_004830924.1 ribosomal protein S15 domain-containing protein [Theileria equi strain WA]